MLCENFSTRNNSSNSSSCVFVLFNSSSSPSLSRGRFSTRGSSTIRKFSKKRVISIWGLKERQNLPKVCQFHLILIWKLTWLHLHSNLMYFDRTWWTDALLWLSSCDANLLGVCWPTHLAAFGITETGRRQWQRKEWLECLPTATTEYWIL